jgi:hypothetical protein
MVRTTLLAAMVVVTLSACDPRGASPGDGSGVGDLLVTDRSAAVEIDPSRMGEVQATCQPGEQAIGGGFGIVATRYREPVTKLPSILYPVVDNYPSGVRSWTVRVFNRDVASVLVTAHVECASRSVGAVIVSGEPRRYNEESVAACPAGARMATGGGWRISGVKAARDVAKVIQSMARRDGAGWGIVAASVPDSTGGDRMRYTAHGVCATAVLTRVTGTGGTATAPQGTEKGTTPTDATAEARCPDKHVLTGAGYRSERGEISLTTFFPRAGTPSAWVLTVYAVPGVTVGGGPAVGGAQVGLAPVCAKAESLFQPRSTVGTGPRVRRS